MFRLSRVRLIFGLILISASVMVSHMYGAFGQVGAIVFAVMGGNFLIAAFWSREKRDVKAVYKDKRGGQRYKKARRYRR